MGLRAACLEKGEGAPAYEPPHLTVCERGGGLGVQLQIRGRKCCHSFPHCRNPFGNLRLGAHGLVQLLQMRVCVEGGAGHEFTDDVIIQQTKHSSVPPQALRQDKETKDAVSHPHLTTFTQYPQYRAPFKGGAWAGLGGKWVPRHSVTIGRWPMAVGRRPKAVGR